MILLGNHSKTFNKGDSLQIFCIVDSIVSIFSISFFIVLNQVNPFVERIFENLISQTGDAIIFFILAVCNAPFSVYA